MVEKLAILRRKYREMGSGGLREYVRWRLLDEALFLHECRAHLEILKSREDQSVEQRAIAIIRWTASGTVHPRRYQTEMNQLNSILKARPSLVGRMKDVTDMVLDEGKKLGKPLHDLTNGRTSPLKGHGKK